jgi:hypothetical protein
MRIKDLTWNEMFIWPPEWAKRMEGSYEGWILINVKLHKKKKAKYIYIEAVCGRESQGGAIFLDNLDHLEVLYRVLNKNINKKLTEIGDMKINI